jgi:hypothetical protein
MITEIPSGLKKTFYVFKIKNKIEINYHFFYTKNILNY